MKERKRRKKGSKRFTHRPDPTLNEKKNRRASAQKADTSMKLVQEQPLMVEKPLKANDDEPMEVVEIRHEDANTALIDEEDQGIDYDINQYLDDPSKLIIIFHSLFFRHPPSRLLRASQALS